MIKYILVWLLLSIVLSLAHECHRSWVFGADIECADDGLAELESTNHPSLLRSIVAGKGLEDKFDVSVKVVHFDRLITLQLKASCQNLLAGDWNVWNGELIDPDNGKTLARGDSLPRSCSVMFRPQKTFYGEMMVAYNTGKGSRRSVSIMIVQTLPPLDTVIVAKNDVYHLEFGDETFKRLNVVQNDEIMSLENGACISPESQGMQRSGNTPQPLHFKDVSKKLGFRFKQSEIRTTPNCIFPSYDHDLKRWDSGAFCMQETLTGGACVGDIDGDYVDDLYYPRLDGHDILLLNQLPTGLVDVSKISGVSGITNSTRSNGCYIFDIDNDGDNDIYISTVGDKRFYLLVNQDGLGTFAEEAEKRGLANSKSEGRLTAGFTIAVADYNVDGFLDIVTTEWMPMLEKSGKLKKSTWHSLVDKVNATNSRIFKNGGKEQPGVFQDVTVESKILSRIPRGTGRDFLNDVDENPRDSLCSGISPKELTEVLNILQVQVDPEWSPRDIRRRYEGVIDEYRKGTAAASNDEPDFCANEVFEDEDHVPREEESEKRWGEHLYLPSLKSERFIQYSIHIMHSLDYPPPIIRTELRKLWRWAAKTDALRTTRMHQIMQKMEEKVREMGMDENSADEYFKQKDRDSKTVNVTTGRVEHRMNHLADFPMIGRFEFGAMFADLDKDSYPDLIISGDFGTSQMLWNLKNGSFLRGHFHLLEDLTDNSMGSTVGDWDMDGNMDVLFTSVSITESELQSLDQIATSGGMLMAFNGNHMFRNAGHRRFEDVTDQVEVRESGWGWGAFLADVDNDGDLDIFNGNGMDDPETTDDDFAINQQARLYMNQGPNEKFKMINEAQSRGIATEMDNRGALSWDFDMDGDLDIFVVNHASTPQMFLNEGGNYYDFLRVRVLNKYGTDSIGAKIFVRPTSSHSGADLIYEIGNRAAFLGQGENYAHFGLKKIGPFVYRVHVQWPRLGHADKLRSATYYNVPVRTTLVITDDGMQNKTILNAAIVVPRCTFGIQITNVTDPIHGFVTMDVSRRGIQYTPHVGFHGLDTFNYTIMNELGHIGIASVVLHVANNSGSIMKGNVCKSTNLSDSYMQLPDSFRRNATQSMLHKKFIEYMRINKNVKKTKLMNLLGVYFAQFVMNDILKLKISTLDPNNHTNAENAQLDLSQVYGMTGEESRARRTFRRGLLNTTGLKKSAHTDTIWNYLFALEHNRIAQQIHRSGPTQSDEFIYLKARQRCTAEYQSLLMYDWLPKFAGLELFNEIVGKYSDFSPKPKRKISSLFAIIFPCIIAVMKIKSSPLSNDANIFEMVTNLQQTEARVVGMHSHQYETEKICSDGFTLADSLDIPSLDDIRKYLNITSDIVFQVNDEIHGNSSLLLFNAVTVGLLAGGLNERTYRGSIMGETFAHIILRQFETLRHTDDGHWFESSHPSDYRNSLNEFSLTGFMRTILDQSDASIRFSNN